MRQLKPLVLLAVIVLAALAWHRPSTPSLTVPTTPARGSSPAPSSMQDSAGDRFSSLPDEARDMLALIARGGPYAHAQDGVVFGNHEGLLPQQPRGYYHEYTVETPGARDRGARRIITGGTPPAIWYYTDDHYRSFRRLEITP